MAAVEQFRVGYALPVLEKGPVRRYHLVEWCAAENDYYHLHYDERVAAAMRMEGTPIQGTYKVALVGQFLRRTFGRGARIMSLSATYRHPDMEGSALRVGGTVREPQHDERGELVAVDFWIEGEAGRQSVTGSATVLLPA